MWAFPRVIAYDTFRKYQCYVQYYPAKLIGFHEFTFHDTVNLPFLCLLLSLSNKVLVTRGAN